MPFEWNYTSINIIFLALFALLYWTYRNRERLGGGQGYALGPVCGMQVQTADAPAHTRYQSHDYWFCSDRCQTKFEADPTRYAAGNATEAMDDADSGAVDPVCGMTVDTATAAAHRNIQGEDHYFCGPGCATAFDTNPAKYAGGRSASPP